MIRILCNHDQTVIEVEPFIKEEEPKKEEPVVYPEYLIKPVFEEPQIRWWFIEWLKEYSPTGSRSNLERHTLAMKQVVLELEKVPNVY